MFRSSSGRPVARRTLIGALALLLPAIAGCEAGSNAPTLQFHPASVGTTTVFNGIKIANAFVLGAPAGSSVPSGSSASMFLSLFNNGPASDNLLSAHAAGYATSVQLSGGTVELPVSSLVNLGGPEPTVVLSNLTKPIAGGQAIPVTLDFQHAGSVTLDVPVEPYSFYFSTYSPPPSTAPATATPAPSKKAKPSATASATASPTPTP